MGDIRISRVSTGHTGNKHYYIQTAFVDRDSEGRTSTNVLILQQSMWQDMCLTSFDVVCCPLQASLGGRVRLMITGAAPISPTVLTFLRAAIGCNVIQTQLNLAFFSHIILQSLIIIFTLLVLNFTILMILPFVSSMKVMDRQSVLLDAP